MQLYKKLKKIAASMMILLMVGACTEGFDDLNTSPNLLTEAKVQPAVLFTRVLKYSIFASFEDTRGRVGEFSQYYASQASGNIFSLSNYTSPFNWYRNYIIDINEILRLTADDPRKNDQNAMARIWKVWVFHIMTDSYGDIPYTEAAKDVENVINQPKYDSQESIYKDLLNELKEAAAQLGSQGDQLSFGNADILYKGNVDSWKKFANSLRLRLAIRVRFADAALASQHINDVISAPLIVNNSENAALSTLQPGDTENATNVNMVYNYYLTSNTPFFVGFGITDVMIPTNDPRLPVFFKPATDSISPTPYKGSYRGRPIQLSQEQKDPYGQDMVASAGPVLTAPIYQIIVMNAAEVYLLRAEAALANITSEDKTEMYLQGIHRSMEQYGISDANVTEFLSQNVGTLSGTDEAQFGKIVTQKYISTFFQGHEGYAEYRRTGYPKVWIGAEQGATNGQIPRRFTYPSDEYLKNADNLNEAIARQGADDLMTRIWWDKRPGLPFTHPLQNVFPPN